jgi:hypothetical protein
VQKYPQIIFQKSWHIDEETIFILGQCESIIQAISTSPVTPEYRRRLLLLSLPEKLGLIIRDRDKYKGNIEIMHGYMPMRKMK